ncbi:MAG: hypothetical protein U0414_24025 [Polyangiaceae bacterium]
MKTSPARLREWLGPEESAAFLRVAKVAEPLFELTARGHGPRFGGIEVAAPSKVKELGRHYRPGLVAWAHEGAGDEFVWDLRHGREKTASPVVLHVDHEIGMATPFAKNVSSALVLFLLYELLGLPGAEVARVIAPWRSGVFGAAIDAVGEEVLTACAARGRRRPDEAVLPDQRALLRAARPLRPASTREIVAHRPATWLVLAQPDDRDCLLDAARGYVDAIRGWREIVFDEGRGAFRWHLAAALRGAADVELRLGRFARAARAAEEAVALYEPLHEAGDARVTNGLAFVHRALAVVRARERKHARAHEHAARALSLYEESILDANVLVDALDHAVQSSLAGQAGHREDAKRHARLALERTERFRAAPPHPYEPQAKRIQQLARAR